MLAAIERVLDRVSQEFGIRAAAARPCVTAFLSPAETVIWTQLGLRDLEPQDLECVNHVGIVGLDRFGIEHV